MEEVEYFDIARVHELFSSSLLGENDVDLKLYINGYKEFNKFCDRMGSAVFGFVKSEVDEKSAILEDLQNSPSPDKFASLNSMIDFEEGVGLLKKTGYVSGCRTLLRLHRGMEFLKMFLRRVAELGEEEGAGGVGVESYDLTLGPHHAWYVKLGARIALHFLPTKANLIELACGENAKASIEALPGMLDILDEVYTRVQKAYEAHQLLHLP